MSILSLEDFLPSLEELAKLLMEKFPEQFGSQTLGEIRTHYQNPQHSLGQLAKAVALSDFLLEILKKQPDFLAQCWQRLPSLADCENYAFRLNEQLAQANDETQFYKVLRQFRCQEMAKLSICQSLNFATVEEIFIHLSQLAESLIIGARDWLYTRACEEMGTPCDEQGNPQQLYVLGMGKLGGFELNFSSDIDLIFTYPENGETQGARRSIENQRFFIRLGQRLINALDQFTADGFVYRTDMRLRPFGDSGALALSFNAMETYYQEQGRDWERYAMIKGRILGADPQDPNITTLQKLLRPFVYRRYIDFSVLQSLREMKQKIEREVRRRGLKDNIKLGAGGIREIEFIVQVFQLIRGGREVSLQQQSLKNLLPEIAKLELLPKEQVQDLWQAYLFLRRVENVLQAIDDKQTQTLPENKLDRARIVESMAEYCYFNPQNQPEMQSYSIQSWEDFCTQLNLHQQKVRRVFEQLIGEEKEGETEDLGSWLDVLDMDFEQSDLAQILQENQIDIALLDSIDETLANFRNVLQHRPIGNRGQEVLSQLMPKLFKAIFAHQACEVLLARMLKIIEQIVTRTAYLELLLENPQALTQLIELCAQSQLIAEQVARHPILLDELLHPETLLNPQPYTEYRSELQQYLLRLPEGDDEQFITALRQFKQSILLRVAAADILGALPVMKVSDHLTFLAEAIIEAVVNLAWQQVTQRFGVPDHLQENQKGFLVIGYGKLGGIELGYKSDLDLVFLYNDKQLGYTVGGKKQIDSRQFYLRLAQKILSIFSMNTSAGILYEVDCRLRPNGDAGVLACSSESFEEYLHQQAWTWEKQALVRSRVVYGEEYLKAEFDSIRQNLLATKRDLSQLKTDIVEMREKMYQHLSSHNETQFNLKKDKGGITDIEFIAQYLVLAYAPSNPKLAYWSDNVRIFDDMAEQQILTTEQATQLKDCYTKLRNRIHHLNLLGQPTVTPPEEFAKERAFIADIWAELLG